LVNQILTHNGRIDKIDAKILRDLMMDGRKEITSIAKDTQVSKDLIWQHFSKLKKTGVIIGSTIQIDYKRLGYGAAVSFFVDILPKEQVSVIAQMRKIPGLYGAYQWGSHSRLWAISDFMKTEQIEEVKRLIKNIPSVLRLRGEIWTSYRRTPENLSVLNELLGINPIEENTDYPKNMQNQDIDSIDWRIIEKLKEDSRASFNNISKDLEIPISTIIRRYNSLINNKIIKPLIQINPTKIGYPNRAYFRLSINSEMEIGSISRSISKQSDIVGIIVTMGAYDLTVSTMVRSLEHLMVLEKEISAIHGIREIETPVLVENNILPNSGEHMSTF
jgi:Lrp/AsnC family transcriptional regulator, regulator for asnA, asnC and gidA